MQRVTITIDDELLSKIDRLCRSRGYQSRSEAIRDLVRDSDCDAQSADVDRSFGVLNYVYSHGTRDLARRITDEGHHHGVSVASMHVHLNRDDCLEVAVLQGSVAALRSYADAVTTQRGVRYGRLQLIPVGAEDGEAGHGHGSDG